MRELIVTLVVTFTLAVVAAVMEHLGAGPPYAKPPGDYQIHFTGARSEIHASLDDIERFVQSTDPADEVRRIRALPAGRWFDLITIGLTLTTAAVGFSIVYVFVADPRGWVSLVFILGSIGGLAAVGLQMRRYRDADPDDERRLKQCTVRSIVFGCLVLLAISGFLAQEVLNDAPEAAESSASVLYVAI